MSALDRRSPPAPGPLRDFSFPQVTRHRLSNGLPVEVAWIPHLPVATALLVLPAGEDVLPEERAGIAVLAGDALEGGTLRRSGVALAEALENVGADLDVGTGWNATTVSLSCLADRLPEALALLGEMVLEPAFPEDEVARMRGQQLARIQQRGMDPGALASDRAAREIFAPGEAYGRPLLGSLESISGVTPGALRGFAEAHYRPAGGGLVVAGDVDPGEVLEMAERILGGWTGAPPERGVPLGSPRSRERRFVVVDRPGSVQSELRLGHPGAPRNVPDYESLVVATAILGGTFSSRLNLNLREVHGYTYGVRAQMAYRRGPGPFSIGTAVDTGVTADAIREAVVEVERYVAGGPTEEEVAAARDYLAGIFPLRLETTGQVASRVAELRVYDLPADFWVGYRDRIRAVTREGAWEAARTHIRPGELAITVVGDAQAVVPALEGLDLGP
ncbi:MAG TPA: pitrilysin family protein, partial [Longimicrobiales bacterium]|nr:pitrilysin family protein [Longimicrobiales bacterium]